MSQINVEEIREVSLSSYDKWFERWYKKEGIPGRIKKAAMRGHNSISYNISDVEDAYLKRRMSSQLFVDKLKKNLDGFHVYRVEPRKIERSLMGHNLNLGWTSLEVVITWKEADS